MTAPSPVYYDDPRGPDLGPPPFDPYDGDDMRNYDYWDDADDGRQEPWTSWDKPDLDDPAGND